MPVVTRGFRPHAGQANPGQGERPKARWPGAGGDPRLAAG
jgi:hypothetical protein